MENINQKILKHLKSIYFFSVFNNKLQILPQSLLCCYFLSLNINEGEGGEGGKCNLPIFFVIKILNNSLLYFEMVTGTNWL